MGTRRSSAATFGNTRTISITKTAGPIISKPGGTWLTGTRLRKVTERSLPLSARLSFLLAVIALGAATIFAAVVRLTDRIAINPWEPAIAMEAVRVNDALPFYDSAPCIHMMGPVLTLLLAGIFRVTGLNLLAAPILMSIFAIALAVFLAVLFCRKCSRGWVAFAVLLFLGINFRTNLALLSAQPDCIAILIACVGLLIWTRRNSLIGSVGAIFLFVCATLFKQTAAAFALVP